MPYLNILYANLEYLIVLFLIEAYYLPPYSRGIYTIISR